MKLNKPDKTALYKARGKAIEIEWPEKTAYVPEKGRIYPLEDMEIRLEVVEVSGTCREDWIITARWNHDPIRILHGLKGVRRDDSSYETEPERISKEAEARIAREGVQKTILAGARGRQQEKQARRSKRRAELLARGMTRAAGYVTEQLEESA